MNSKHDRSLAVIETELKYMIKKLDEVLDAVK
jgi:hypothetical protein